MVPYKASTKSPRFIIINELKYSRFDKLGDGRTAQKRTLTGETSFLGTAFIRWKDVL